MGGGVGETVPVALHAGFLSLTQHSALVIPFSSQHNARVISYTYWTVTLLQFL